MLVLALVLLLVVVIISISTGVIIGISNERRHTGQTLRSCRRVILSKAGYAVSRWTLKLCMCLHGNAHIRLHAYIHTYINAYGMHTNVPPSDLSKTEPRQNTRYAGTITKQVYPEFCGAFCKKGRAEYHTKRDYLRIVLYKYMY